MMYAPGPYERIKRWWRLAIAGEDMFAALKLALKQIRDTEDSMMGQGFQVCGWHLNGDTELADNFFIDNDCGAVEAIEAVIAKVEERTRTKEEVR
jgi:hypothetical protein